MGVEPPASSPQPAAVPMAIDRKALTAEEKAARGIAPVKPEHVVPATRRVVVGAVAGIAAAGNGEPVSKKSKRQYKKEKSHERAAMLCAAFSAGRCNFGDGCRSSHDVPAYLATKPPELPGACPFNAADRCPYGIACRYASTHAHPDELTKQYLLNPRPAAAAAAADAIAAVDAGGAPAPAPGLDAAAMDAVPAGANGAAEDSKPVQPAGGAAGGAGLRPGEAAALYEYQAGGRYVGDGTIPSRVVPLPEVAEVSAPVNLCGKELQAVLRKRQYDFSRALGVLADMGVQVKGRPKANKAPPAPATEAAAVTTAAATPAPAPAAGAATGVVDTATAAHAATPAAAAALQAVSAAAEMPAAAPAAAAATEAEGGQAAGEAAGAPSGEARGEEGGRAGQAAAAGEAGGDAAGPPPKRPRSAGDDAGAAPMPIYDVAASPAQRSAPAAPAAAACAAAVADARGAYNETRLRPEEKRAVDFRGKTYLAPLTTVGNLPFRRLCKALGADITCGEMAMATNLLQGQASEWALLKRHPSEDCFGVQVCGGYPDSMAMCAQLLDENIDIDFVDVNCGCPIDLVCDKGAGSSLLTRPERLGNIVRSMSSVLSCPLTFKIRKGYLDDKPVAHTVVPRAAEWGAAAVTLHGRTRQQRYTRLADWDYIRQCAALTNGMPLIGNGDCFSHEEWYGAQEAGVATTLIARGALIKPWIFTEIKERRTWDISAGERFDILRAFCSHGLEQWGADTRGVETTRRFLLEWLSYTWRYVPVGLLEVLPQRLNWRPPPLMGRSDLETLLASDNAQDWVRISEMLLGPAPPAFNFAPKHKSNAYATTDADLDVAFAGH